MVSRIALAAALIAVFTAASPAMAVCLSEASDMLLAPSEVRVLTQKAKTGDKDAAARLSIHYDAGGQPKEALKWLLEAAKLGDCGAAETMIGEPGPKLSAPNRKLAQDYANQWGCKPGVATTPPVPVMY